MNLSDLKAFDQSFELIESSIKNLILLGISHSDCPEDNHFVFIKNQRFLNEIGRRSERNLFEKSGVVFEKEFFTSLDQVVLLEIKKRFGWIGTVADTNRAMCAFSKPFYDKDFSSYNLQVDGRKMGSTQIDPTARIASDVFIGEDVKIGKEVVIMPGCVVMPDVSIGEGTILFPNISVYPKTRIGSFCRIHAGTVIGSDGFGYNFLDGTHQKIWHLAGVVIEDHVEIGGNTMIDSGAFIDTFIGTGTKIDNLVQISHNVSLGKHNIVCGTTGLAGSVETGDFCAFGAGAGAAPSARFGNAVQIAARAAVSENARIEDGAKVAGHPARPLSEWLRSQATLSKISKK